MMDLATVMRDLEAAGTEQNRKVYPRHGVKEPLFGVSYAALGELRKQIKRDHALACGLWATRNHDARILATMVADPQQCNADLLAEWAADLDNYVLSDALSSLMAQVSGAYDHAAVWVDRPGEWIPYVGWNTLTSIASRSDVPDEVWVTWIDRIRQSIHGAPNRVRYSMNNALIAISGRSDWLAEYGRSVAAQIGKVQVDHGETGCKTPDAATMITKIRDRQARRGKPQPKA